MTHGSLIILLDMSTMTALSCPGLVTVANMAKADAADADEKKDEI
jgi:hypothetical protein